MKSLKKAIKQWKKNSAKPSFIQRITKAFFILAAAGILATLLINIGIILAARKYVYTDIGEIPPRTAVLVSEM